MSPESYVLLLISCWLLLASALLWGMLRIARRHCAPAHSSPAEQPKPPGHVTTRRTATRPAWPLRLRLHAGVLGRGLAAQRKLRY